MDKGSKAVISLLVCVLPLSTVDLSSGRDGNTRPQARLPGGLSNRLSRVPRQEKPAASTSSEQEIVELRADLVTVTVTVVSPGGRLVTEMTAQDFEILEDGAPQSIMTFSRHSQMPLSLVMLIDGSLSIKNRLGFQKEALARFLRAMVRPVDSVAIVSVSTDVIWQQPFTADLSRLLSAIERLDAEGATALYDAVELAASALNRTSGRRVIVILSDGRDTISRATLSSALKRAQEADAVVYAINTSGRPASANVRELAGERALERLCNQTGGEVFFPDKIEELDPVFTRLTDQLRTQYVLGFSSTNEARDGSYRRLTVRVKHPNMFARAREGYYALKQ